MENKMKKKYELISVYSGIGGAIMVMIGLFSFVYFFKMTTESIDSWMWKPFVFIGIGFLFMIPMAIYSNKTFDLEVQEVKGKTSEELDIWIEESGKKFGMEYVNKVMRKAGYVQKWEKDE
jgi:hypothetical protein